MADGGRGSVAGALVASRFAAARSGSTRPATLFLSALSLEREERRVFLWLPAAAGAGVFLYLSADREPVIWLPALLAIAAGALAVVVRGRPAAFGLSVGALALAAGFLSAELRTWRVGAPMLDRTRIATLTGFVEEVDPRPEGARFILLVETAPDLAAGRSPARVRLTTKHDDGLAAGMFVEVKARLFSPSSAALPGGYDFARDAYFAGIGAVGSALGRIASVEPPRPADLMTRWRAAVDRARNALAARVDRVAGGGEVGAVAAAMVTGKRDLLTRDGRDIIRQAGIFHIITIAGVQMTLVAALLFGVCRRGLALSQTLALRYPIKKWAAAVAILGAVAYDIGTGSRIGTQRALFMTTIMLGAVLADRRGLTMRNLALAALAVIAFEPEAVAGASFQLSFAAVAALIAVQEARARRRAPEPFAEELPKHGPKPAWVRRADRAWSKVSGLFVATVCATAATASFMAAEFHELSPYVFIGNPLTLTIIELFAVPGALLGTILYPLGLDAPVWHWVGLGIRIVFWAARHLAAAPGATVHVRSFAPWALPCFALALLSVVIWRTTMLRLTALPLIGLGFLGAASGPRFDVLVAPTGESVAVRAPDGMFGIVGHANSFVAEQWLRADGDARLVGDRVGAEATFPGSRCDKLACVAPIGDGQWLSVVADPAAFEEDCQRADVVVTPLFAPASCAAELILDRGSLESTGAVALSRRNGGWSAENARAEGEDRPWSPAPAPWRSRGTTRPRPDKRQSDGNEASPSEAGDTTRF